MENQSLRGGEPLALALAAGPSPALLSDRRLLCLHSGAGSAAGRLQAGGSAERAGEELTRPPGCSPADPGECIPLLARSCGAVARASHLGPMSSRLTTQGAWVSASPPLRQHVSPMRQVEPPNKKPATAAEDDEDDDIDLFGSDEEDDKEAARLREERLRQYAEKKAKKPALVAKSSILLDVKPVSGLPLTPPPRGPGGAELSSEPWAKRRKRAAGQEHVRAA